MKRIPNLLGGLLSLAVVGVVLVLLVLTFGARGQPQVAQQPYPVATVTVPALPLPATPTLQPYPPPATPIPPMATPTPPVTITPPLPIPTLVPIPVPPGILAGEKIAFLSDNNLQLINVASRALAPATVSGNINTLFGWSWDGSKILLGVGERPRIPESDDPGGMDLWVMNADGTSPLQLTEGLEVLHAAWSPVRDQIAYGTRDLSIYVIDSDQTGRRELLAHSYLGPWSPDGSRIVYRELAEDYSSVSLSVLNIADGARRQLISDEVNFVGYLWSQDVQWSLDGQSILFQSRRSEQGTSVWWKIDISSGQLMHLDNETLRAIRAFSGFAPRSPIANQVAFSAYDFDFNEIVWVMDFNGYARAVARGSAPAWSPNGNKLVYKGEDNGLWVINLDGTGTMKLADIAGHPPYYWNR